MTKSVEDEKARISGISFIWVQILFDPNQTSKSEFQDGYGLKLPFVSLLSRYGGISTERCGFDD